MVTGNHDALSWECVWKSWYGVIAVECSFRVQVLVQYRASLNSACWQHLVFPEVDTEIDIDTQALWGSDDESKA